ncbi:unnamed protein product, partial [Didymodactylos carnosus]
TQNVILVGPNDIFIRHTHWHDTIWPYLFAIDANDDDFKRGIITFLRAFPVESKPSCSQCINVLKNLYEKSQQEDLDPNYRETVITAILYYMTSLTDDSIPEAKKAVTDQIIYLPNLCSVLTSSQQLYYVDQPKYKILISKCEQLKQLCFCHNLFDNYSARSYGDERLKQLENDCKGNRIKKYFPDLRPISDILDERINEDSVTDDSTEISSLTDTIHTSDFYRACIVQHFFRTEATEENTRKLIQFLNELEIYITTQPITASIFNKNTNQMIDGGQIELPKYLKTISADECATYILYIYNMEKNSSDADLCDELTEIIQQQCYATFSETTQEESVKLLKVIRAIIRGNEQDYDKILDKHNINEGGAIAFDNLTFLPKLGSLVELADLQYLVQGIYSCAPDDYVAPEVHTNGDENETDEDVDNTTQTNAYPPEYRHPRIKKLAKDHVNDFEKKYEVEIEPRKYEIISAVYLYRFNKPSMKEIQLKGNDDANSKQILLANMPSTENDEAHRFTCLEALKEQIDKDIENIKPLAAEELQTAVRRLQLHYHPDKHPSQTALYVPAFQYLQQCLHRLLNRSNASTNQTHAEQDGHFHFTNFSNSGFTYAGSRTNFSYYFGSATRSNRNKHRKKKNPQPSVALKWLSQARYNMKELREYQKRAIYLRCCIKSYYVALDVIYCVMIAEDWNSVKQPCTLSRLTATCSNDSVKTLCTSLLIIVGEYEKEWKEDFYKKYSSADAHRAYQLAEELYKEAKNVFET